MSTVAHARRTPTDVEHEDRKRHADRLVELLTNNLDIIARDCRIVSKDDGRDVTSEVIIDRARNGAQAIIGNFLICPRGTR